MAMREQLERLVDEMVAKGVRYEDAQREFEKRFIAQVLQKADGNLGKAADLLGMHRNTLSRKIAEYRLDAARDSAQRSTSIAALDSACFASSTTLSSRVTTASSTGSRHMSTCWSVAMRPARSPRTMSTACSGTRRPAPAARDTTSHRS